MYIMRACMIYTLNTHTHIYVSIRFLSFDPSHDRIREMKDNEEERL